MFHQIIILLTKLGYFFRKMSHIFQDRLAPRTKSSEIHMTYPEKVNYVVTNY